MTNLNCCSQTSALRKVRHAPRLSKNYYSTHSKLLDNRGKTYDRNNTHYTVNNSHLTENNNQWHHSILAKKNYDLALAELDKE